MRWIFRNFGFFGGIFLLKIHRTAPQAVVFFENFVNFLNEKDDEDVSVIFGIFVIFSEGILGKKQMGIGY